MALHGRVSRGSAQRSRKHQRKQRRERALLARISRFIYCLTPFSYRNARYAAMRDLDDVSSSWPAHDGIGRRRPSSLQRAPMPPRERWIRPGGRSARPGIGDNDAPDI